MIYFPNAKINLGLNIVSKRTDGYHNLETIFYPIGVKDGLEIILNEQETADKFVLEGIQIDGKSTDNLVMKALRLMREHYDFPFIEVHLLKKIPFGAGIGGGSADAAFMLRLLNDMFNLQATDSQLAALAVQLGADCPFFIYNRPMYAEGIGEKLHDIQLSLAEYNLVLVKPNVFVSTKEAFSKIVPTTPTINLREIVKQPITEWKNILVNDFESSVFPQFPQVEQVKNELYTQGAIYASMSGSGSSVYGIFEKRINHLEQYFADSFVWQSK